MVHHLQISATFKTQNMHLPEIVWYKYDILDYVEDNYNLLARLIGIHDKSEKSKQFQPRLWFLGYYLSLLEPLQGH